MGLLSSEAPWILNEKVGAALAQLVCDPDTA